MLAFRQRCCAAGRAASKSFCQGHHEQKKQVVEGMMWRGAWVVELPRSTWRFPSRPHTTPISPSSRPMLLLLMRGAKRSATPSTAPTSIKPKTPHQQNKKQHPDVNSTSDLFVRWEIPWDGKRVIITMTAIGVSFLISGLASAILLLGCGYKLGQPLNADGKSILFCTSILLQTLFATYALKACIKSYSPLPKELFSYDWRNPFGARRGWLLWGVVGIFCAVAATVPTVLLLHRTAFPMNHDILREVKQLIGTSGTSTALLLASVGVLAPFLEETVFRGFLLTSLTKWVPTYVAVLLTAGAFAVVHVNTGTSPVHFALGVVFGFAYSKTGNLLTPIMIHGVWNSTVILIVTYLLRHGYGSLQETRDIILRWRIVRTTDSAGKE